MGYGVQLCIYTNGCPPIQFLIPASVCEIALASNSCILEVEKRLHYLSVIWAVILTICNYIQKTRIKTLSWEVKTCEQVLNRLGTMKKRGETTRDIKNGRNVSFALRNFAKECPDFSRRLWFVEHFKNPQYKSIIIGDANNPSTAPSASQPPTPPTPPPDPNSTPSVAAAGHPPPSDYYSAYDDDTATHDSHYPNSYVVPQPPPEVVVNDNAAAAADYTAR